MITLTLLHPIQSIPVQSWHFEPDSVIRIGRSTDNNVVLYSAVVSRHHAEIRPNGDEWEVVNLGANGLYVDGKRIDQMMIIDGMIIRLATSGPKIQIQLNSEDQEKKQAIMSKAPSMREKTSSSEQTDIDCT